jgi:hypothetical protein
MLPCRETARELIGPVADMATSNTVVRSVITTAPFAQGDNMTAGQAPFPLKRPGKRAR